MSNPTRGAIVTLILGVGLLGGGAGCKKKGAKKDDQATANGTGTGSASGQGTGTGTGTGPGTSSAEGGEIANLKPVNECPKSLSGTDDGLERTIPKGCTTTVTGDYYVTGVLIVEGGATLQAQDGAAIYIGYYGPSKLIVKGTAQDPAVFTAAGDKAPGAWKGVHLYERAARSSIEGLVLEYAGADGAALVIEAKDVTLKGSTIRKAGVGGLEGGEQATFAAFGGNTFDEAGKLAVNVDPDTVGALSAGNTFSKDAIVQIRGGEVSTDATWVNPGAPYVVVGDVYVDGKPARNTLTISAGTELRFTDAALYTGYYAEAALEVQGTEQAPVVLTTSRDKEAGSWKGLIVYGGHGGKAKLEHATFEFAGSDDHGALEVQDGGDVSITRCTFRSSHIGINLRAGAKVRALDGNTFEGNDQAAIALVPESYGAIGAGNTYGKGEKLALEAGTAEKEATWAAQGAPTEVTGEIYLDAPITIGAGSDFAFKDGAAVYVGYYKDGAWLKLAGTADKPVRLHGVRDDDNVWVGVHLYPRAKGSVLEHAELRNTSGPGIVVDAEATATVTDVSCGKCAAGALQPACGAKVTATDVKGTDGTPVGEIQPEGC